MLKGLGGLGDMAKMMKAAQDMQTKMTEMQEDMHNTVVTGESGAGLVKATCTCKGELKSLDIDPSIFNSDDKLTAAQQRARQRDSRRYEENPYRTMEEELAERRRKRQQAERRGRPEANPRDERFGDRYFNEKREVNRYIRCNRDGEGCDYISDAETYSRLYRANHLADRAVQDRAFRRNVSRFVQSIRDISFLFLSASQQTIQISLHLYSVS